MRLNLLRFLRGGPAALVLASVLSSGAPLPAHALDLVIKATANEAKLGFTDGQEVTFTFTINPLFVNTSGIFSDGTTAVWLSSGADTPIFSWFGMTGVSGSYSPILGSDPQSSLTVDNEGAMTVAISYDSLGYLADGEFVFRLLGSFVLPDSDFTIPGSGDYVDPTTYFMGYQGSYSINPVGFGLLVNPEDPDYIEFTVTNFQIVPEPSSILFFLTSAIGVGWVVCRRRSS